MALKITCDCIACAACVEDCPNGAISEGPGIYVIDPERCVECVGFRETPQCVAICPVDACVPDPDYVETREELLAKKQRLATMGSEFCEVRANRTRS
ncbi:MAG: YfhL family 4Fe-4S dicluster ferredoxin [Acidobacteria bacterium]|nr:YfhL family 4Fe-4S dicluster ferredoxin [Acidobacteriota bacterium]